MIQRTQKPSPCGEKAVRFRTWYLFGCGRPESQLPRQLEFVSLLKEHTCVLMMPGVCKPPGAPISPRGPTYLYGLIKWWKLHPNCRCKAYPRNSSTLLQTRPHARPYLNRFQRWSLHLHFQTRNYLLLFKLHLFKRPASHGFAAGCGGKETFLVCRISK